MKFARIAILLSQLAIGVYAAPFGEDITVIKADCKLEVISSPSGPSSVSFSMTNTGNRAYKILHSPATLFTKLSQTEIFHVAKDSDSAVSWDYEKAAKDSKFVATLGKGATVRLTFDIENLYDFSNSGPGQYILWANPMLDLVDTNGKIVLGQLERTPGAIFKVSNLWLVPDQIIFRKTDYRAQVDTCTPGQRKAVTSAAAKANKLIANANTNIRQKVWSSEAQEWFGDRDATRVQTLRENFRNLARLNMERYNYFCQCPSGDQFTIAYVFPNNYPNIAICPLFFEISPNQQFDTQAGTIVHEASHFIMNGGTADHRYNVYACRALAMWSPDEAVLNANSYKFYAESCPS